LLAADQLGIRLEFVRGLPLWEASPVVRHQRAIDRIRASISPVAPESGCACVHFADIYVHFPDGSLKRPDIAIFCQEPAEEDEAVRLIPEAVIEVVSRGFEAKDLEIGPPFYLSQGVKDIVVFDPHTLLVLHIQQHGAWRHTSPVELTLCCGCTCRV
ncbi:MAG: Uma2 family endonuclease, partial [Candidatus Viridilinea halotolerans]